MATIPVSGPWITQKEIDYVTNAVTNAWYGRANEFNERFEKAFADYLGVKYAVSLPSCTSAIHLSLVALGVGPGDEVIVPDVTWIASAAPVSYVGGAPVFADIDPLTWCLSPKSFERCVTDKTKAVIPVDLYGGMPDMEAIHDVAGRYGLAIIEDAAEAIGSEFKQGKAGAFGDTAVFSFHGSKTMTTGEGGMLVTQRPDIYESVLFYRDHGRRPGDKMFWNTEVGYKYKMSSMQAALGLAQIERIGELVKRKREIFSWYERELMGERVTLNYEAPRTKNSYWMVTIILDKDLGIDKERFIKLMGASEIDCRPFFNPLSSLPAYEDLKQAKEARRLNLVSYDLSSYGVNLPSGMDMTEEKVRYVCRAVKDIIND